MNRTVLAIVAALAALSAGCEEQPQPQPRSRPTMRPTTQATRPAWRIPAGVVADAIGSMGGLAAWRDVGQVSYDAVIAYYDEDGRGYVNRHRQVLDVRSWTLSSEASAPWNCMLVEARNFAGP